jgi:hypothetical protein
MRVVDGHRDAGGGESAAVQAFILDQQRSVLTSAWERIAECAPSDLGREAHRLRGTLGTYQMTDGVQAMTALEAVARNADVSAADLEAARSEALAALSSIGPGQADERGYG